jgi:hypothetical protein
MQNELRNMDDLIGKTIFDYHLDGDDVYFLFTDETFIRLRIHDITEGFGYQKSKIDICEYGTDETNPALVELGVVTKEVHDEACRKEEEEWKREREEETKRYEDILRRRELEEYERLKNKLNL